jgi:hypothetical protein
MTDTNKKKCCDNCYNWIHRLSCNGNCPCHKKEPCGCGTDCPCCGIAPHSPELCPVKHPFKRCHSETEPKVDNDAIHEGLDRLYGTEPKEQQHYNSAMDEQEKNWTEPTYHQRFREHIEPMLVTRASRQAILAFIDDLLLEERRKWENEK